MEHEQANPFASLKEKERGEFVMIFMMCLDSHDTWKFTPVDDSQYGTALYWMRYIK